MGTGTVPGTGTGTVPVPSFFLKYAYSNQLPQV